MSDGFRDQEQTGRQTGDRLREGAAGVAAGRDGLEAEPRPPPLACPVCGGEPVRRVTRYGLRRSCCGLWSWGGRPLADAATHAARQAAHAAFDPIWKEEGATTRSRAYEMLAEELGLAPDDCHMAVMDAAAAARVPAAADAVRRRLAGEGRA